MKYFVFFLFFLSILCFFFTFMFFLNYNNPLLASTFQTSLEVTQDKIGFDVNSSAVTFGKIALGGTSTRSISGYNPYPYDVRIDYSAEGSIASFIKDDSFKIVQPYEHFSYSLSVFAETNASIGNYTGNISIFLLRA